MSRILLDADASSVVSRVALRTDDIPIGEQTVAQVSVFSSVLVFASFKVLVSCHHVEQNHSTERSKVQYKTIKFV